ncbi:aminodeoxychorismate synthase component I [Echinicola soli]|uniref:aminodeoxychorismate synthase n=1 Tax=Echinicola soli TaxID=2591634 RepID=A0A514CI88_9BACT|nr:aminodeoxychorismate synthase component I [Echinicola soli]QDH79541.1 aminodeoxychorismate synthase component I [Echinicola soli]
MMDAITGEFPLKKDWIEKAIHWAVQHFDYTSYHHPNSIPYPGQGFPHVLYAGQKTIPWNDLESYAGPKAGILSYDLKNKFERLKSQNPSLVSCPEACFFLPELTIFFHKETLEIKYAEPQRLFEEIGAFQPETVPKNISPIHVKTSRNEYIQNVRNIQDHIREGDIYEMNYCIAFEASVQSISPVQVFLELQEKSPMPFASFFKCKDQYLVGASPERFIKKQGNKLIAQPIKGTIRRGQTPDEDQVLKETLRQSEKERAENLMIVDLMRNDLARIAQTGTVTVDELFGIYPFRQVYQMISTVSATLRPRLSFAEIIAASFPMGSMTGAPKIKCMELIERYENFKRGWFSGTIGYMDEEGNIDFSVIIRSIIIDTKAKHLFFAAGSAITYDADPAYEYEECLLKASAIHEILST